MFYTSVDILNWVLAICITLLTFFLCWMIYHFALSIRRVNRIAEKIEKSVTKAEELISVTKEKLKNSSAYLMIFGELAKKAMEFMQEKRKNRDETNKKTKK